MRAGVLRSVLASLAFFGTAIGCSLTDLSGFSEPEAPAEAGSSQLDSGEASVDGSADGAIDVWSYAARMIEQAVAAGHLPEARK